MGRWSTPLPPPHSAHCDLSVSLYAECVRRTTPLDRASSRRSEQAVSGCADGLGGKSNLSSQHLISVHCRVCESATGLRNVVLHLPPASSSLGPNLPWLAAGLLDLAHRQAVRLSLRPAAALRETHFTSACWYGKLRDVSGGCSSCW